MHAERSAVASVVGEQEPTSRRPRRTRLAAAAAAVVTATGLVVGLQLLPDQPVVLPKPPEVFPAATGPVLRIAPDGTGSGRSAAWSDAAPLSELPAMLATAAPGTQVWLLADRGPYLAPKDLGIRHGGTADAPVVIRGVDQDGAPRLAEITGDRTDPYDPAGPPGREVFRLLGGADHLVFQELAFRNVGNGAFRIAADISDLTIRQSTATNVRRFIENTASTDAASATVTGLTVTNVTVTGFSRGVARLRYDSNRIQFDGVTGDSEGQDGDPFTMGIQLAGTVHDVDLRNTAMSNSISTDGKYWNGDGFTTEAQTYDIRFANTYSSGHTDGGYDLKSRSTVLVNATATDSKRNFRFWGDITVDGCRATDPLLRGGNGTQAQIHATHNAVVTIRNCTITDTDPRTIVFDVDGSARLTVVDSVVEHSPQALRQTVEPDADLQIAGIS